MRIIKLILTITVILLIVMVIYKSNTQPESFYASFDEKYIDPKIHPYSRDIGFRPDAQDQPNANIKTGDGIKLHTHLTDIEITNQKLKSNQNLIKKKKVRFANPPVSNVKYITEPFTSSTSLIMPGTPIMPGAAKMSGIDTLYVDEDIDRVYSNDIAIMDDKDMTMTIDECVNTITNMGNMTIMIKDTGKCDLNILNDNKYNECINNLEYENMATLSQTYQTQTYDSIYTLTDKTTN